MTVRPRLVVVVLVVAVFVLSFVGAAESISKYSIISISGTMNVSDKGDVKAAFNWSFPRSAEYMDIKAMYPNPYVLLREVFTGRSVFIVTDKKATYNDGSNSLSMSATYKGAAAIKKKQWEFDVGRNLQLVWSEGNKVVLVDLSPSGNYFMFGKFTVVLPAKAKGAKYSSETGLITYTLPQPLAGKGQPVLDTDLKCKPRIMASAYKSYANKEVMNGNLWAAKLVLKNAGQSNIKDIKVSYKLGEYSDWSEPSTFVYLTPGSTACDVYYPIISGKVAELRSPVQVDLQVRISYKDEKGNNKSETDAQRVTLLGINQFEFSNLLQEENTGTWADNFSNASLLPTYVTRLDDAVKAFAGMASQLSGGAGAAIDDEQAVEFVRAVYDLEVANGLSYQTPSGFLNEYTPGQDVKFPRDVLRDKSGTCVDLAILYASVCQAVGLDCYIMLIPGHAYPVMVLPGGSLFPVEATGVGGAAIGKAANFDEAVKTAEKNFREDVKHPHYFISISDSFTNGVSNPELPALDADSVQKWGYKLPQVQQAPVQVHLDQQGQQQVQQQGQAQEPIIVDPPIPPPVIQAAGNYEGEINLMQPHSYTFFSTLVIKQTGTELTGTLQLDAIPQASMVVGKITQSQISFRATVNGVVYDFQGTVQSGTITGQYWAAATGEKGNFRFDKL